MHASLIFLFALLSVGAFAQPGSPAKTGGTGGTLLFSDDFTGSLDTTVWIAEIAPKPPAAVYTRGGQLWLDTRGGVTVWLKKKLGGNWRIEYTRRVVVDTGSNDRLSDLNTFWMASDPRNPHLFTRDGVLESYDSLQLYYVGQGGNSNSTTRFRRYEGNGQRTLVQEYTDTAHLMQANREYTVSISKTGPNVTYAVDGVVFFSWNDPRPLQEGYFGFRSTKSRQAIGNIRVYRLP
ncbi:DUF6250 domain-containing protein [Paraflavisolibacter sp. H34]|uniref:DUF6250 domain-containing protein n=1 Tax=Huijunlia imazamoxiresistens TaxID=3127457 RepID=UPI00301B0CAE